MTEKQRKIQKPTPISGFPEWLPEERIAEQQWFDHIRKVFESYGFGSIETPSVEALDILTAKGEVDKEIYVIDRLHKDDNDKSEARLALHFDQTVPLARYVAQRFNDLTFPFKRYQMQRVWRGERPQAGRFREFYQCDIDVINVDSLPLHFDAEMAAIMVEILQGLNVGPFQMQISNRKILQGYLQSIGLTDGEKIAEVFRAIDKIGKISGQQIADLIRAAIVGTEATAFDINSFLTVIGEKYATRHDFETGLKKFSSLEAAFQNATFKEGVEELSFVIDSLQHLDKGLAVADLSIVRGLDYYTGTVYETRFLDNPNYGSICSGGRYDDLAGSYINKHLPGVGISIGFSRLFDYIRSKGAFKDNPKTPTDILVCLPSEEKRSEADKRARALRKLGYNVELYHSDRKIVKQFEYAEKKGIPFVWIPPLDDAGADEFKDMKNRTQEKVSIDNFPPKKGKAS